MNTLKDLLYILNCALRRKKIDKNWTFNIEKIYKLAINQGVWHIIYETLEECYDLSAYKMKFLTTVTKNISANKFSYNTVEKLELAGIECCYLKGLAISWLYPNPDCRISSDTDILISAKASEKTTDILKELGYTVGELKKNHHHFQATHPNGKLLEVHTMLYEKTAQDFLFYKEEPFNEPYITLETGFGKIKALGINDGLIFLTIHLIKHFLSSNVNLRQLTDLLLYMEHYNDKINWKEYNEFFGLSNYDKFIDAIKEIGNIYFEMSFDVKSNALADELLGDFIFENENLYTEYCNIKSTMNKKEYKKYIQTNFEGRTFWRIIFPSKSEMQKSGYVKTDSFLGILYAHFKRYINIIKRTLKKEKKKANSEKMELLKKLGMIE